MSILSNFNDKKYRKEYQYEKRIVAFLDILGFRQKVMNPQFNIIFAALFNSVNEMNHLDLPLLHMKGITSTSISDSIVISIKLTATKGAFDKLLSYIYALATILFREEILLRGALAVGGLYHKNNIVFGPALVCAYELERDCAVFPRIIISNDTFSQCLHTCRSDIGRETIKSHFREDSDGFLFYDYMRTYLRIKYGNTLDNPQKLYNDILSIKEFLEKSQHNSYKIEQKYNWLKRNFNMTLEDLEKEYKLELKDKKISTFISGETC
jgi:hypothetical protein